ncbi:hypothetical protein COCSADRAFT_30738 [Bipolaris sorokiniana ND90Pr]|uniref:Uncharacterized protein n=1 Tax=Cochliobolus sativus (strain ND90Pr / ATCC 201652) TaxID=665912 RepID=M2RW32_COCSN|nr:uncharacterized protein COCSADRAFT_30738 [Bipolaris sorokiniana ND90Pr]EMD59273.1 hypothetical protein COCSADRAFT_30738 [Bipolaris sorokiniana ND90Pr]
MPGEHRRDSTVEAGSGTCGLYKSPSLRKIFSSCAEIITSPLRTCAHWYGYISKLNTHSSQLANPILVQIESKETIVDRKLSVDDRKLLVTGYGTVPPESWIILMMPRTRWKQASKPRDLIFLSLGILKSLTNATGSLYNVDYSQDELTSLAAVARHLLLSLPYIVLLSFCARSCQ